MIKNIVSKFLVIFAIFICGCASSDPSLVSGRGQVYSAGLFGQTVSGDESKVSVWNIWNAKDGLPLAEQHCQQYGKGVSIISHSGITGYYECVGRLSGEEVKTIFDKLEVKKSVSNLVNCIRENVIYLDDLTSDASTIALGVVETCRSYWDIMASKFISNLPNSNKFSSKYTEKLKRDLNKNKNIKVLPYVLTWRNLVKNGWNKSKVPTIKEMPDTLFPKSI